MRLTPLLLCALCGCFPPPLEESGLLCAPPERGCGEGYACFRGHCLREGDTPSEPLIARGARWRYWDQAGLPAATWAQPDYDDRAWLEGAAPLGYGQDTLKTTIGYGANAGDRHPTAYFRHRFDAPATSNATVVLRLIRDDGAIVYLNGTEVLRSNMPDGPVGFETFAAEFLPSEQEQLPHELQLEAALLRPSNVLAVEVHQSDPASSDLELDVELSF